MMKLTELDLLVKKFEKTGKTSEELNSIRSEIFNALDAGEIQKKSKDRLLKDLYFAASLKNIFFVRVTERKTAHLPKDQAAEDEMDEYGEGYEESYEDSYEDSYEEDEEDEEVAGS